MTPIRPLTSSGLDPLYNAADSPSPAAPVSSDPDDEPSPLVTFVFTDIEDSTGHWQRMPSGMRQAQARHDQILRQAWHAQGGRVFRTVGDAFCVAFGDPVGAVCAALDAQIALGSVFLDDAKEVPLRVRIAVHSGPAEPQDDDFYGLAPARAARVLEGLRGGQVIVTRETADLVRGSLPTDASLSDLGPCRLRSFEDVEHLFQLHHPALPLVVTPPRSAVSVPNNLPRQVTPFFGREGEIAEARRRLGQYNLVTLVGMGGCGKTRLALRLTDFVFSDFADGIYFVDLSGQRDDAQVAQSVATTLGVRLEGGSPIAEQVAEWLREKSLLLILDNCEQILDGAAELAGLILETTPRVRMIATSREALGVLGESLVPVNPFPAPGGDGYPQLLKWEAVRLFAERAASQSPRFQITPENARAVAAVCRRVEGIPLGLVLSAAWAGEYTPEQIETQLEARYNLLMTGRIRSLPARHRTLYATVDWGYSLLSNAEQTLLRRLAIFRGGCSRDAARIVCGDGIPNVALALDTLVRKSLLTLETPARPDEMRYRPLDPVREYGEERLRESGEWATLEAAHRAYYVAWAEAIAPRTIAPDARAALEEIDAEQENLQAALQSAAEADDNTAGVGFIASLYWHWHIRGLVVEGRGWIARFLSGDVAALTSTTRIKAFNGAGILAYDASDYESALFFYEHALTAAQEAKDEEREAGCLTNVGSILAILKRYEEAEGYLKRCLSIYELAGNHFRIATIYNTLGYQADAIGDYIKALHYHQAALDVQRQFPVTPSLGVTLLNLTRLHMKQNQWDVALSLLRECFEVRQGLKNSIGVARALDHLPEVLVELGRTTDAALILGAAQAYRNKIGVDSDPETCISTNVAREKILISLGKEVTQQKELEGHLLNLDDVTKVAFQ